MPGDRIEGDVGDEADGVNVGKNIRSRRSESGRQTVTIGSDWDAVPSTLIDMRNEMRFQSQQLGSLSQRMSSIESGFSQLKDSLSESRHELLSDIESLRDNVRMQWILGAIVIIAVIIIGIAVLREVDQRIEDIEHWQNTYQRYYDPSFRSAPGDMP